VLKILDKLSNLDSMDIGFIYAVMFWFSVLAFVVNIFYSYSIYVGITMAFAIWMTAQEHNNYTAPDIAILGFISVIGILAFTVTYIYRNEHALSVITKSTQIYNLTFIDAKNSSEYAGIVFLKNGENNGQLYQEDISEYYKVKAEYFENKNSSSFQCYSVNYNRVYDNEVLSSYSTVECKK